MILVIDTLIYNWAKNKSSVIAFRTVSFLNLKSVLHFMYLIIVVVDHVLLTGLLWIFVCVLFSGDPLSGGVLWDY